VIGVQVDMREQADGARISARDSVRDRPSARDSARDSDRDRAGRRWGGGDGCAAEGSSRNS
ncbi:hypothetical protein AB0C51_25460, partial [Streptomyces pathocidini]